MSFTELMQLAAQVIEWVAAAVLIVGLAWSVRVSLRVWRISNRGTSAYQVLRRCIGSVLLLGIDVVLAADLVRTLATQPSLENVAVLALIVLIRTVLSFSLEIEMQGVPPWRRATMSGAGHITRAAAAAARATLDRHSSS